jgi:hypothetical protein
MLSQIPVYAVMVEDLGERGAHYMAYKEFCKEMYVPPKAVPLYVGVEGEKYHGKSPQKKNGKRMLVESSSSRSSDGKNFEVFSDSHYQFTTLSVALFSITLLGAFIIGGVNARAR